MESRRCSTVLLIDPDELERRRHLRNDAIISSLALNSCENRPKISSLFDFRRMESDCDEIFEFMAIKIVRSNSTDWKTKFEAINWSLVERGDFNDSIELRDVILSVFDVNLMDSQIDQLLSCFRDSDGSFNYNQFLLQLFKHIEIQEMHLKAATDQHDLLLQKLKAKAKMIGSIQLKISANANERALQRAMKIFVQSLRRKIDYNEDLSADSFRKGELTLRDFRSEMKRVLNADFSDREIQSLFSVFDKDGNGTIDRSELSGVWYRVIAEAKLDKAEKLQKAKDIKKIVSGGIMRKISNVETLAPLYTNTVAASKTSPTSTATDISASFSTPLTQAMSKLTHAAKNGRQLLSLPDDMIPIDTARNLLKDCAGIRLTKPEMEALVVRISFGSENPTRQEMKLSTDSPPSPTTPTSFTLPPLAESKRPPQLLAAKRATGSHSMQDVLHSPSFLPKSPTRTVRISSLPDCSTRRALMGGHKEDEEEEEGSNKQHETDAQGSHYASPKHTRTVPAATSTPSHSTPKLPALDLPSPISLKAASSSLTDHRHRYWNAASNHTESKPTESPGGNSNSTNTSNNMKQQTFIVSGRDLKTFFNKL